MILFIEFCQWAIEKNLDIDTDDDVLWSKNKFTKNYYNYIKSYYLFKNGNIISYELKYAKKYVKSNGFSKIVNS